MYINFKFQLKILFHLFKSFLIISLCLSVFSFIVNQNEFPISLMFLFQFQSILIIVLVLLDLFAFVLVFSLFHLQHSLFIILVLFLLCLFTIIFYPHIRFLLLILQQFQSLQEHLHLFIVFNCHFLGMGLKVQNLYLYFLNLFLCVVIELLHHITIHLDVVSF